MVKKKGNNTNEAYGAIAEQRRLRTMQLFSASASGAANAGAGTVPIDLGVIYDKPLTSWENAPVLKLDSSYSSGDLASLLMFYGLHT
jgi:hypothetical protein